MPSRVSTFFTQTRNYIVAHKVLSAVIALVVVGGGYYTYKKIDPVQVQTTYALTIVQTGTIISTVSASGQVSPSDEVTVNPKASGQVTRVLVKDGQSVSAGQALAYIDATDEYNSVQSAKASLESAELSLQKLQEPATALQTTQAQDAVTKAQQNQITDVSNLANEYTSAYNDIVATFLDLPTIQTQLQDVVTGTEAGHGSQWNIDYYENAAINWDNADALAGRSETYGDYQTALSAYTSAYADYQETTSTSATSTVLSLLSETYTTLQSQQTALNAANSFIQFYETQVKNHSQNPVSEADSSISTLSSDIAKINSHLSALQNDKNQITSDQTALINDASSITENQESLSQLQAGPDALDLQSQQLSIQQQQNALQQAEDNLADYTITAPISGMIANLDLHVGDTVGSGTSAATLITDQDIADLSLNEVDAAKVSVGQQVTLTFDAIPNLSLTGTIVDVSPLGTVSQGVVSYDVKVSFTAQDPRVKAGMTVNADIQTAVHENVLEVPASAIKTLNGSTYVQAFDPVIPGNVTSVTTMNSPVSVPVTVGISDNTNTEIDSGLTAGQQIVRSGSSAATAKSAASTATTRGGFGGHGGGAAAVRL